MNPPVFLVGALRSGTTLLRLMLDHHPDIGMFGEFEYAVRWYDDDGPPPIEQYHRQLLNDRVFRAHAYDIDPGLDYPSLVRSFVDQAAARSAKPLIGAAVHSNFQHLTKIWPNARFIHLVRDPRDVARSCIGMGWVGNVYYGAEYWIDPVRRWESLSPSLSDAQKFQLRFEDLVVDPVAELTKICDFLGVSYSESMLDYPEDTTYSAPDPTLVEQWRRKLDDDQIMWVESACGPWMGRFGYELRHESVRAPSRGRLVHLAAQNRYSRVRYNIDRYGLPLYVSWQIAKRMPPGRLQTRVLRQVDDVNVRHLK
jgi:hypothetical protein